MKSFSASFFTAMLILFGASSAFAMKKFEFLNCYKSAVQALDIKGGNGESPRGQDALRDLGMLYILASIKGGLTSQQVAQYRKALQFSRDCNAFLEIALAGTTILTFEDHNMVGLCSHKDMPFRRTLMELNITTSNLLRGASNNITHLQQALHIKETNCGDIDKRLKYITIESLRDQYSEAEETYDRLRGIP